MELHGFQLGGDLAVAIALMIGATCHDSLYSWTESTPLPSGLRWLQGAELAGFGAGHRPANSTTDKGR